MKPNDPFERLRSYDMLLLCLGTGKQAYVRACQDLGTAGFSRIESCWEQLLGFYRDERRSYHAFSGHILYGLSIFLRAYMPRPVTRGSDRIALCMIFAWFYHDAYIKFGGRDNEERSADIAAEAAAYLGFTPEDIALIRRLIMATKHLSHQAVDEYERIFQDIDFAIMGDERLTDFLEIRNSIAWEYSHVPWPVFCRERAKVLSLYLERGSIYSSGILCQRREEHARQLLTAEIEALRNNPPDPRVEVLS